MLFICLSVLFLFVIVSFYVKKYFLIQHSCVSVFYESKKMIAQTAHFLRTVFAFFMKISLDFITEDRHSSVNLNVGYQNLSLY